MLGHIIFVWGFFLLGSCNSKATEKAGRIFEKDHVIFLDDDMTVLFGYFSINESNIFSEPKSSFGRSNIANSRFFLSNNLDKDIKFKYYSREITDGIILKDKTDFKKFMNVSKVTKCITHGWMSSGAKDTSISIKDGFLHKYDANVVVMDWSQISGNVLYPIPMRATTDVGKYYGSYLNYMVEEIGIKPEDIHLVGHSLGAHISGFAGREVRKGKLARITGLDPALPGFNMGLVESGTLRKTDASFVDIIHTCAGVLGYKDPLGHADVYPNGGIPPQPGCLINELSIACSHGWSWKIFASSLLRKDPYIGIECTTLSDVFDGRCTKEQIPIGDPIPQSTRGIFYSKIETNKLIFTDCYDKY